MSLATLYEWFDLVEWACGKCSSCEVLCIQWLASIPQAAAAAAAAVADVVRSPGNLLVIESAVFRCVVIHWTSEIKDYKPLWATGQATEADRRGRKIRLGKGHSTKYPTRQREKYERTFVISPAWVAVLMKNTAVKKEVWKWQILLLLQTWKIEMTNLTTRTTTFALSRR